MATVELKSAPSISRQWLMPLFLVAAAAVFAWSNLRTQEAPNMLRAEIQSLAAVVQKADRVGDRRMADASLDQLAKLLRKLEEDPMTKVEGPRRMCLMAALRMSEGAAAVSSGSRWPTGQYDAAIRECR